MSMDLVLFANVCDVALRVYDVALRVFDGERSVLCTQVCNTQLLYPRYWVTYLGYRLDLYLHPCLWYWIIEQGEFLNTPIYGNIDVTNVVF
jgi:hypothetical protein